MSDGFEVDTDAMRAHAAALEVVTRELQQARDAVTTVSAPSTAFGIICTPLLAPPVMAVEAIGITAVTAAAKAVGLTAEGIRAMADAYDAVETAVLETVRGIDRVLGPMR